MAMAGPPSTAYRLNYSRRRFTDDDLQRLRRELPLRQDAYPYEEVDFSQNEFSSTGLRVVLEVCRRCPKLRVLKLYRNQIDDAGAKGLADLCGQCLAIEEMHLSHNHFTATGVEALIIAAEQARPDHMSPLWLRLEQNDVGDADAVFRDLQSRLSVCNRQDEVRCTVRVCCRKMKVHLPFFNWQRGSRYQPGSDKPPGSGTSRVPENAEIAGPSFRVPRGEASPPAVSQTRSAGATPKSNAPVSNGGGAWDLAGAGRRHSSSSSASPSGQREGTNVGAEKSSAWGGSSAALAAASPAAARSPGSAVAVNGTRAPVETPMAAPCSSAAKASSASPNGDSARTAGTAVAETAQGANTAGVAAVVADAGGANERASVVLDQHGRRRILPEQLETGDASNQFVCLLCKFVIIRPVITTCSHLFCDTCFRGWVGEQVSQMKKGMPGDGPVPLIPCPQPRCQMKLRRTDIMPMEKADASKVGAVQLLQRLRNNLTVRCVHHTGHFKHAFGKDAERVARDAGTNCTWVGDLAAYEEHIRKGCPVETHLGGSTPRCCKDEDDNVAVIAAPAAARGSTATASAAPVGSNPAAETRHLAAAPIAQPVEAAQQGQAPPPPPKAAGSKTSGTSSRTSGSRVATPTGKKNAVGAQDGGAVAAAIVIDQGEVRVARYDYNPRDDKAQIVLKANDFVRIFEVTESGWAAGVRLCKETMQEVGDAGWFPAGYLFPPDHVAAK